MIEKIQKIKEILDDLNYEVINDWNGSEEFYKLHEEEMQDIKKIIEEILKNKIGYATNQKATATKRMKRENYENRREKIN